MGGVPKSYRVPALNLLCVPSDPGVAPDISQQDPVWARSLPSFCWWAGLHSVYPPPAGVAAQRIAPVDACAPCSASFWLCVSVAPASPGVSRSHGNTVAASRDLRGRVVGGDTGLLH